MTMSQLIVSEKFTKVVGTKSSLIENVFMHVLFPGSKFSSFFNWVIFLLIKHYKKGNLLKNITINILWPLLPSLCFS